MFGRKHQGRRRINILFVIFRLILSLIIFALLLGGAYSAYKHFSGLDPLKLNPEAVFLNLLKSKTPQDIIAALASIQATKGFAQNINQKILGKEAIVPADSRQGLQVQGSVVFRFLIIGDSHSDTKYLTKALEQAKLTYPDLSFILGVGDYSEVGTVGELENAKAALDSSGLRYFLVPGDHDLWDARNQKLDPVSNFNQVFGPQYQSFSNSGFHFILIFNSDNYSGLSENQFKWLNSELTKATVEKTKGFFIFLHEPLYHPSSDHIMGRIEGKLKEQAKGLILTFKNAGVRAVVAGDTHYFSQYSEPETGIFMTTIGALTSERNVQTPRYGVGEVLEDGNLRVLDVEIR